MRKPTGMQAFTLVWLGQLVSLLGTAMTQFGITIWAWQVTGEATALALVGFFSFGPTVLLSPFAGAVVDRMSRKRLMIASDLAAGCATIAILILVSAGQLEIWHLYVAGAVVGSFAAFQFPAYSAAITLMLPKEQYTRASGMLSLAESVSMVAAPALAGIALGVVGLRGILAIDVVTFVVAVTILLAIEIPDPTEKQRRGAELGSLWSDSLFGFRYILARPSLLGLQGVFFSINLAGAFTGVLIAPMVLARTGNNELALGSVQSMFGVGGVVGALLLSTWGGPKRRVHGVLLGLACGGLLGQVVVGLGQGPLIWASGMFLGAVFLPIVNGSNQAIWQAKVRPAVQGRVFAARRLIAAISAPLAMLLAGPAADRVFEPAMMPGGTLAPLFGGLVGTGAGAGMSLMFVFTGLAISGFALAGYLFPAIRNAEKILPDHDAEDSVPDRDAEDSVPDRDAEGLMPDYNPDNLMPDYNAEVPSANDSDGVTVPPWPTIPAAHTEPAV